MLVQTRQEKMFTLRPLVVPLHLVPLVLASNYYLFHSICLGFAQEINCINSFCIAGYLPYQILSRYSYNIRSGAHKGVGGAVVTGIYLVKKHIEAHHAQVRHHIIENVYIFAYGYTLEMPQ